MKIRQMEWSKIYDPDKRCYQNYCEVEWILGFMRIEFESWKEYTDYCIRCYSKDGDDVGFVVARYTLEDAKECAEEYIETETIKLVNKWVDFDEEN